MDEHERIRQAQRGDDEAFGTLVHEYLDSVYAFCRQYLGTKEEAEDAAQETFVKAWRAFDRFNQEKPLKPWLLAIARNCANDIVRKRRTVPFSLLGAKDDERDFSVTIVDDAPLPDELFAASASVARTRQAVGRLPARDQLVLRLRYTDNLSFEEIAELLDVPATTARSVHFRALGKLRVQLEETERG